MGREQRGRSLRPLRADLSSQIFRRAIYKSLIEINRWGLGPILSTGGVRFLIGEVAEVYIKERRDENRPIRSQAQESFPGGYFRGALMETLSNDTRRTFSIKNNFFFFN